MQRLRYVILLHRMPGCPHLDLMIEDPQASATPGASSPDARNLKTWRMTHQPALSTDRPINLTPLPDHRRIYLSRTGPIASGKGSVQRITHGTLILRLWTLSRIVLEPITPALPTLWELRKRPGTTSYHPATAGQEPKDQWQLRVFS